MSYYLKNPGSMTIIEHMAWDDEQQRRKESYLRGPLGPVAPPPPLTPLQKKMRLLHDLCNVLRTYDRAERLHGPNEIRQKHYNIALERLTEIEDSILREHPTDYSAADLSALVARCRS